MANKNKKVSIVLSGGSIKGSWECGMLLALSEVIDFDNDIECISGTSVGSLNGSLISTGTEGLKRLRRAWDTIKKPKNMIKKWAWGIPVLSQIVGFFKGGLYSLSPIEKIINREVKENLLKSKIKFYSCSVDMVTGNKFFACNQDKKMSIDKMRKYILASSSMAPAFKPVEVDNMWLTDGGCRCPVPVSRVTKEAKESEYIIILLARPIKNYSRMKVGGNLYDVAARNVDFLFDEVFENDVQIGLEKYWSNKKYIIVAPDKKIFDDSLDIDGEKIQTAIKRGYNIGKKAFKVLKGFNKK